MPATAFCALKLKLQSPLIGKAVGALKLNDVDGGATGTVNETLPGPDPVITTCVVPAGTVPEKVQSPLGQDAVNAPAETVGGGVYVPEP